MENNIPEKLINLLKEKGKRVLLPSNGLELRTRCPYCGDSRKNSSSAHMYISLEPPFLFNCFRCETSGRLTPKVLRDFEIDDSTFHVDIIECNKKYKNKSSKTVKGKANFKINIYHKELAENSIKYFNQRYNTNYTLNDADFLAETYRVILDPITFLYQNKIQIEENNPFNFVESIGFLSFDKTYAIFRNINPNTSNKMRYQNIPLLGRNSNSKMYAISTNIDLAEEKVNFIMTEGIFDIIGVYEHFYKSLNTKNNIFIASCGKSYRTAIDTFIRLGFLDFNIIIYSDSDVSPEFYKDMKNNSEYFNTNRITIYYNNKQKDFGIPKNEIELRKVVV